MAKGASQELTQVKKILWEFLSLTGIFGRKIIKRIKILFDFLSSYGIIGKGGVWHGTNKK
jgi:hypothetical protein